MRYVTEIFMAELFVRGKTETTKVHKRKQDNWNIHT